MNPPTISSVEIQQMLGLSKNQVKGIMRQHGLAHDGTPEMKYGWIEAQEIISKEKEKALQMAAKRLEVSERRKEKREAKKSGVQPVTHEEFAITLGIDTADVWVVVKKYGFPQNGSISRVRFEAFLEDNGKERVEKFIASRNRAARKKQEERGLYFNRNELGEYLGLDRYEVKSAIKSGLIEPDKGSLFLKTSIESMDKESFLEKLVWEKDYSTTAASKKIGVSNSVFLRLMEKHDIEPAGTYKSGNYNVDVKLWRYGDFAWLEDSEEVSQSKNRSERIKTAQAKIREDKEAQVREIHDRIDASIRVGIRDRSHAPEFVALQLGPTNSGKTYNALQNLCEEYEANPDGVYVYAGPLRMLAYEVYTKLGEKYGMGKVGFITGEEQINPSAHILATTVEMAPSEGDVLIVDEAHWITDPDRGYYWTRLLMGGKYRRIHVIAAAEVKDGLTPLVEDAWHLETNTYERRTGISFDGTIKLENVPEKTAVVCFSRRSVYAAAQALTEAGKSVCVLYGALPVQVRKKQIQDFMDGKYDVIVTTDVIGHGINLPIDNVAFAETEKFDGKIRRTLHTWEAGQIAGRAGRFGLSEKGKVYLLSGRNWFSTDTEIVKSGVAVASGKAPSDLVMGNPEIAPVFGDFGLGTTDQINLLHAIESWQNKVKESLADRSISPANMENTIANLYSVANALQCKVSVDEERCKKQYASEKFEGNEDGIWSISTDLLWQLIAGPFDPESPILSDAAIWLNNGASEKSADMERSFEYFVVSAFAGDLMDAERAARLNSELKMIGLMFSNKGRLGTLRIELLEKAEKSLNERIEKLLEQEAKGQNSGFGQCSSCGGECKPWFHLCDDCYSNRRY